MMMIIDDEKLENEIFLYRYLFNQQIFILS